MLATVPVAAQAPAPQPTSFEARAEQAFERGDLTAAIYLYRQAASEAEGGERHRLLVNAAWLEHLDGRDQAAAETLVEALTENPTLAFRTELYSDDFRRIFRIAQEHAVKVRQARLDRWIYDATVALRAGDLATARQLLDQALAEQGDSGPALYNLALVDLYEKDYDRATAGFERVLALASAENTPIDAGTRALALTNLGFLHNHRRNYREAIDVLEQAITIDADIVSTWTNLGIARRRLGLSTEAAAAFRRAYEMAPEDPSAINNLALAYIDDQEWISAVGLLAEAIDAHPDNSSLRLNLGLAQLGMGNDDGAAQSFEEAIRNDPTNDSGYAVAAALHLARFHRERGQWNAVADQAQRAITWQPDNPDGWNYRGLAQKGLGQLDEARASLEKAKQLDPTRASIHNNLAAVLIELGEWDAAEAELERALAMDANLADAQANLAALRRARAGGATPRPRTSGAPPPRTAPARTTTSRSLGLRYADVDYRDLGLSGVMVAGVVAGSLAARADIRPDDLLLRVDGHAITDAAMLEAHIDSRVAGAQVRVDLLRRNVPQSVVIQIP